MTHHGRALRAEGISQDVVDALACDTGSASQAVLGRSIVEFAQKLTLAPSTMPADDTAHFRNAGLSDRAILDVTLIT